VPSMEEFLPGLVLLASVGEEGEGNLNGMRHFCSHSPYMRSLSTFLVLDGAATAHITTRAIGSRRYEVSFTGPGGHSWSDYGVPNPVHALSRAIALFTETRLNASPRSSINVGVIEGGASVNSIPPLARAKIDIRSECNQQIEALSAALQSAVERSQEYESQRSTSGRLAARIREIGSRPAGVLDERSGLPATLKYVDAHLGIRSHFDCASTDANIPLARGIPAVSIGAGGQGGGAHTAQEWFSPEGRDLGLKRILLVLCMRIREAAATGR
ncbi:MAG: peptidase, partial [Acidobacteria bacterium]|nr:peptidase [Acidobacteriota bacterium]